MTHASEHADTGRHPVVYAGRLVDRVAGADLPNDCLVLGEQDALPYELAKVLNRASMLILLDPFSFPLGVMTGDHWNVPMVVVLPSGFDAESLTTTAFGSVLFERLTFFDRILTSDSALWRELRRKYRLAECQRLPVASNHPSDAAAKACSLFEAESYDLGSSKALHRVQAAALEPRFVAAREMRDAKVPFDVLQVGAGVGRWASSFDPAKTRFVGLDGDEDMVRTARANFPDRRFNRLGSDLLFPYDDESFDLVFSVTFMHHNPGPAKRTLLSEMWRVARPGGRLLFLENFVFPRRPEKPAMYPISVTEFVNLILDATVGQVVLEHAESLWYPHENLFTSGLIALLRLGVPPRGQELSAPPAAPRARGRPATRGRGEPASAEPFPADPNLPHLEAAKDPERMREVFQGHLRSLGEEAHQIRECQISRIRYRKADYCRVQYALSLAEPGTGRERSQLVTGTMFAGGRTRRMWEKLRRSEPEREIPGASSAFAPFFYIPELDMLVEVFPYDRELPGLPLLMAGPPPELEPLLLARFGPGDWRFEAWDVEPVKYLPERRATLRLTARARDTETGWAEERRFYAKVYSNGETGERIHRVTRALWEKAGAGDERFTVARPIAYLGDGRRTLIQEEVPGTLLRDRILLQEHAIPEVRKTARALAVLHLDRVVDHVVTPRRTHLQKEVANMERIGELLRPNCPHLGPRIEEIVGAVVAGLEEGVCAPTHGDFKPDNILLDGDRLALIDLDEFTEADPVQDAARFLAHLTAMPLFFALPHDRAWAYARAFAEEYFAHVPEAWRDRLPLHYARNVFKMAPNFLQRPQPGWPDKLEALLQEAEDSLAGRVW